MTKNILLIHSTIRGDEKLIIEASKKSGLNLSVLDVREMVLNPYKFNEKTDLVLERCVSTTIGLHAITFFESLGIPVVSPSSVARVCMDKFATSLIFKQKNVPTVPFAMAFNIEQAKKAVEELGGYPVVLKPPVGSWGRLLAKINDADSLEAVIEQKEVLGTPPHKAFYFQKFVEKKGRDIRAVTCGDRVVCAIYRQSEHWITNTAQGATPIPCPVTPVLEKICLSTQQAIGGGILGIDIFETASGFAVNEVNHTTEFKNVQRVTGVDVATSMLEYCKEVLSK